MKIFFITHNKWDYNCYLGHVIVANNETEVRELSKKILLPRVLIYGIMQQLL